MQSQHLGLLLLLASMPSLAQVQAKPSSSPSPELTPILAPRQHAPRHHFTAIPDFKFNNVTVSTSTNWSGYAVTGSSFTNAKGTWVVPAVNCSKTPNTYAAFWVGIDGWNSNTVEQTGTDSDCSGASPSYYAWYEFYPKYSYSVSSVPVAPGNVMSAEVVYNGSEFTTTITNETTGKSFSISERVNKAKRSSAEWIAEAPCCTNGGGILPLADFSSMSFGSGATDTATDSSTSGVISKFGSGVNESVMVNGSTGANEAVPSSLGSDGSSFSVTWDSE